jgi:hypothetical protein
LVPCTFPGACARKQAVAAAVALLAALLAGCGSGGSKTPAPELRRVRGDGYSFDAPAAWRVVRGQRTVEARRSDRSVELVRVTVFPLARPFRPALWGRAVAALDRSAAGLATQLEGRVHERTTVSVGARRARRYVIRFEQGGTQVAEEFTFLLDGRREYQLVCRREAERELAACARLTKSFRPA